MKNRLVLLFVGIALALGLVIPCFQAPAFAEDQKTTELMITSLEPKDVPESGKETSFEVNVVSVDSKNPKNSMKPYNDAKVYVYFKKGDKVFKETPKLAKDGDYQGKIKLPDVGTWKVLVMALKKGQTDTSQENLATMSTEWDVQEPKTHVNGWLIAMAVVVVAWIILMIWRKKRRSNK